MSASAAGGTGGGNRRSRASETNGSHAGQRRTIVLAAIDAVAAQGAGALRADAVAREAGIATADVEDLYRTPAELSAAVTEHVVEAIVERMSLPAARRDERIAALGRLLSDRPSLFLVFAELELRGRRDPRIRPSVALSERRLQDEAATLLGDAHNAAVLVSVIKGLSGNATQAPAVLAQLARLFDAAAAG